MIVNFLDDSFNIIQLLESNIKGLKGFWGFGV